MLAARLGNSPTESNPSSYKSDTRDSTGSAQKPAEEEEVDEEEDEAMDEKGGMIKRTRTCKACVGCRSQKMRCLGSVNGSPCNRCVARRRECVFVASMRGRQSPRTKTDAMATSLQKIEQTLNTVLNSMPGGSAAPPTASTSAPSPLRSQFDPATVSRTLSHSTLEDLHRLEAAASAVNMSAALNGADAEEERQSIVDIFESVQGGNPSPPVVAPATPSFNVHTIELPTGRVGEEQSTAPVLLFNGILSSHEVLELFQLFFEHCNRQAPLLEHSIHTPSTIAARSPFLFTCICTVASRYYTLRKDGLYAKCLRIATQAASEIIARGAKSLEIVQGFLLLSLWNLSAEELEANKTWLFVGIAVRMATDLRLNSKITLKTDGLSIEAALAAEMDVRNRERTWLICFITDRSLSVQQGKPSAVTREDFLIRTAHNWHSSSSAAREGDLFISACVELHRLVSSVLETFYSDSSSISGLNDHLDYRLTAKTLLAQLDQWRRVHMALPLTPRALQMVDFYHSYYRMFLLSFAIQHAQARPELSIELTLYATLCFDSASVVVGISRDFLGPNGQNVLRHGMDSLYIFITYAAVFLLKLTSPAFAHCVDASVALHLVQGTAETFERSAIDPTHIAGRYARFLRSLVENWLSGDIRTGASRMATRAPSPQPGEGGAEVPQGAVLETFDSTFWENMLMPGFGGPIGNVNGDGGVSMFPELESTPWGVPTLAPLGGDVADGPGPFSFGVDW